MTGPGNSRPIDRHDVDPRVASLAQRHLDHAYDKPIQAHNRRAFDWLAERIGTPSDLILDAGCGTGLSTVRIADRYPGQWVIGVDKSLHRLARGVNFGASALGVERERVIWIRADLIDFWRLAAAAGWRFQHHYLLYPNPWPKPAHLQRRWHGHPVLPALVRVSRSLTLRTNWPTYATEFCTAMDVLGVAVRRRSVPDDDLSPFDLKYRASGHSLTEVVFDIDTGVFQDAPPVPEQT